jgi:hypothetical protein
MSLAKTQGWSDILATCYAAKASILREQYLSTSKSATLVEAKAAISFAREILIGKPQPAAEIEVAIEELRLHIVANSKWVKKEVLSRVENLLTLAESISSKPYQIELSCFKARIFYILDLKQEFTVQIALATTMIVETGMLVYLKDKYSDIGNMDLADKFNINEEDYPVKLLKPDIALNKILSTDEVASKMQKVTNLQGIN